MFQRLSDLLPRAIAQRAGGRDIKYALIIHQANQQLSAWLARQSLPGTATISQIKNDVWHIKTSSATLAQELKLQHVAINKLLQQCCLNKFPPPRQIQIST